MQLVHAQQRRADALHAALGHIHGHDRVGVDVVEVLVGQRLLQLLDAHHAAEVAFGLGLAFGLAKRLREAGACSGAESSPGASSALAPGASCDASRPGLGQILGQILGNLILIVVTLEQSHGDQSLYLARM